MVSKCFRILLEKKKNQLFKLVKLKTKIINLIDLMFVKQ